MLKIIIHTLIHADRKRVFDLARSIDLHQISAEQTKEKAIAGRTSGLIEFNETVTWRAKHFGFYQQLTVKITEFDAPNYFVDEMVQGAFKSFKHTHTFEEIPEGTIMTDVFHYQSPFGVLGRLADFLFLKKYMKRFLEKRNEVIKAYTEKQNAYL